MIRLVSVSGGKDSTATLLLAIEEHGKDNIKAVFADTGNEHQDTLDYLDYIRDALGIEIFTLRQDFTAWWWRRRDYVRDKWPDKGVPAGVVARALDFYELGPTGNPFLDLCIIKGRFPSRKAQFCTQFLKTEPLVEYAMDLVEEFGHVESWQGVRADESLSRSKLAQRENNGGDYSIYRPILYWNVDQVFAQHRKHGIEPNPLYKQGMGRVGCMPCINTNKDELLAISKRFPEHIDRIAEWELIVGQTSKRQNATFLPAPGENDTAFERGNIHAMVEWSQTKHGGKLIDWIRQLEEPKACQSAYGLCE